MDQSCIVGKFANVTDTKNTNLETTTWGSNKVLAHVGFEQHLNTTL